MPVVLFLVPTTLQALDKPLPAPEIAYGAAIAAVFLVQFVPNNLGMRSQQIEKFS